MSRSASTPEGVNMCTPGIERIYTLGPNNEAKQSLSQNLCLLFYLRKYNNLEKALPF